MHTKIAGIRKQWTACQLQGLNLLKGSSMKETLSKNAIFALHKSIKVIICKNSQMTAHSSYGCRDFTRFFLYRNTFLGFISHSTSTFMVFTFYTLLQIHSVAKVYAVLPFYDVKCLCSGGWE